MSNTLPAIELIEPAQLAERLKDSQLLILDVCNPATYRQAHIPGAVHIAPGELVSQQPPVSGWLPSLEVLNTLFSRVGYQRDKTIVVYDDEGGGWAGRLAWTLDLIGHQNIIYLNGGLHAWIAEQQPLQREPVQPEPTQVELSLVNPQVRLSAEQIMEQLDGDLTVWDARSPEEYTGSKQFAARAGHIPGAINFEWTEGMDKTRSLRIRADLTDILIGLGLGPEKNIVTHCQSHHRSGFTYLAARVLGYPNISAYDGSWSEWGNRSDTPVALD